MRAYKTAKPQETINLIQNIFAKYNIDYSAEINLNKFGIYSSHCRIQNNKYMQTNGKGIGDIYSVASALAEAVERLQTLMIFSKNGIQYESLIKNFADIKINGKIENILFGNSLKNEIFSFNEDAYYSKFLWVDQKKEIKLPLNYLINNTGSNGLSSGNTYEECIMQGICECFERFALLKIFNSEVSPPIINDGILRRYYHNYGLIEELRSNNIIVRVFDLSCGMQLPVVATLTIYKKNNNAVFKVGAEPVFTYALNRCLTETFQQSESEFFEKIDNKAFFFKDNEGINYSDLNQNLQIGMKFPNLNNLFSPDSYELYSDYICGKNTGDQFSDSLNYLFNTVKRLNKNIFIKDFNFLGFPTVYVYIETISNINNNPIISLKQILNKIKYKFNRDFYNKLMGIFDKDIAEISDENINDLIIFFEMLHNARQEYNLNFDPAVMLYDYPGEKPLNTGMILLYLYLIIHNFPKANQIISKMNSYDLEKNKLLCVVRDYIHLMPINNLNTKSVLDKLGFIYDPEILESFVMDIKEKRVLKYLFISSRENPEHDRFIEFKNHFFNFFNNSIHVDNYSLINLLN